MTDTIVTVESAINTVEVEGQTIPVESTVVQVVTAGTQGPEGPQGPAGSGLAAGGTAGQFLRKLSSTDYDAAFATPSSSEITLSADVITDTSYVMLASDNGKVKYFTSATAVTVVLPNNLPFNFNSTIVQLGDGQITFVPSSGATLSNSLSHTKTLAKFSPVALLVYENTGGSSAKYLLGGETA